jgi:hypothetical protein
MREGPAGIRVERIAEALGATMGSFYRHFRNRSAPESAILDLWDEPMTPPWPSGLNWLTCSDCAASAPSSAPAASDAPKPNCAPGSSHTTSRERLFRIPVYLLTGVAVSRSAASISCSRAERRA